MDNDKRPSVVPICAHLAGIDVVGNLEKSSSKRPDHFAVVYVDDKEVAKSVKKPAVPAPRWEWQEGRQFWFQPSSIIKIMIYREGRTRIIKHLVGEHTAKVTELLETDATIDFQAKDKSSTAAVAPQIKINLSLVSGPDSEDNFNNLMKTVDANVFRLDNTGVPSSILALGRVLQLTKNIMDIVGDAHPILKASWSIMYSAYAAVQQVELLDDSIRELAESLREMLGIAKEYPDLLVIKGTTNVIEETGRASLKAASLIHEYTKLPLIGRTLKTQLLEDMKSSIAQCHISFENLRKQFITRGIINMNHHGTRIEAAIEEIDIKIQRTLETIKDDQLAEKFYRWLSAPDSSKNYNEAREKQQRNTSSWFLDGMRFRELQETPGDLLWIKGTAGCGKTILCSSIIEKIIELHKKNASVALAYFFFDGRDSQKELQLHDKLLRSLILQLSRQCDGIPAALVELYGHGEQQPSSRSLQDTLHRIIDGLPLTYVIIDSLDECTEREKTLQWIEQIISRKIGNLHMVVASRPERDITDILQPLDPDCVDLATEITPDITIYLEQQLSLVKKWNEGMREIIKSTLTTRANGMFRWVALQLTELKKCSNEDSVKKQLGNLPKGLNEAYDQILLKFSAQADRNDTKTFLMWLSFSTRPMALAEIAEAIVVDLDTENGPQYVRSRRYWDKRDVLEKCSGLISESEGEIKLAHFSIKEYLVSDHLRTSDVMALSSFHLTDELSHSLISQTCLAYILQFDAFDSLYWFWDAIYPSSTPVPNLESTQPVNACNSELIRTRHLDYSESLPLDWDAIMSDFPLTLYAANHWIFHARSGDIDNSDPSLTLTLAQSLFAPGHAFFNWRQISEFRQGDTRSTIEQRASSTEPLYHAALAGLQRVSQHLLEKGLSDENGLGDALYAASSEGHEGVVKLLLAKGAVIYIDYALAAASRAGYEGIARLLLEKGADVNGLEDFHRDALYEATYNGHTAVVKLLLQEGAVRHINNALRVASQKGHETCVKLLLEKGADVNGQEEACKDHNGALQEASERGFETIVKLLLEKGADVNMQAGFYYGSGLYKASLNGHAAVVKLLLENGADIEGRQGDNGSPLYVASYSGHIAVVKLLLEKGAIVNAPGGYYGTALQAASNKSHISIVKLLLDSENAAIVTIHGNGNDNVLYTGQDSEAIVMPMRENRADNAHGEGEENVLYAASFTGDEATVKLLLENMANVNAQKDIDNALYAASHGGHNAIVMLLLENGADPNLQRGDNGNALYTASYEGHYATVALLLEKGADVNAQGGPCGNALQAASYRGYYDVMQILLKKGANVNLQGGLYGNALNAASSQGHEAAIRLLLENRADVDTRGEGDDNALYAASSKGDEATVQLLLENGASVNAQRGDDGNALYAASYGGHNAIGKLLLGNGANVNAQGGLYGSALQAASYRGCFDVMWILLEKGANVDVEGGRFGNALQAASYKGYVEGVMLLLEHGANVNVQGGECSNALWAASYQGHEAIVKLLLEKKADVDVQLGVDGNALYAASDGGHEEIVKLLLDKGAGINARGGFYGNALQAASYRGSEAIVGLLLDNGADANAQGGRYGTALQAASVAGREGIMKLLLEKRGE